MMGTPSVRCSNKKVKVVEIDQFKNTQEDLAVGRGKGKQNNAHREDSNKIDCPAMKQVTVSVCSRLRSVNIPERKETANKRKNVTYWILQQRGCFMSRRLKA